MIRAMMANLPPPKARKRTECDWSAKVSHTMARFLCGFPRKDVILPCAGRAQTAVWREVKKRLDG